MRFSKDGKKYYGFGRVGRNANKVCDVYKLGLHCFKNGENMVLRLCFLRTKKAIYFIQYEWQIKPRYDTY